MNKIISMISYFTISIFTISILRIRLRHSGSVWKDRRPLRRHLVLFLHRQPSLHVSYQFLCGMERAKVLLLV